MEIVTIASNYHIEVNPSDVGIHDRVVIQELIKNSASSQQIATTNNDKEFKVVVITEVDRLTKDAQHALRRTMEKYMSTCKNTHCYSGHIIITLFVSDCEKKPHNFNVMSIARANLFVHRTF